MLIAVTMRGGGAPSLGISFAYAERADTDA